MLCHFLAPVHGIQSTPAQQTRSLMLGTHFVTPLTFSKWLFTWSLHTHWLQSLTNQRLDLQSQSQLSGQLDQLVVYEKTSLSHKVQLIQSSPE